MGEADDVAAVAGQELVLPVFHRPMLVRAVVQPRKNFGALPYDAQLVVQALPQQSASLSVRQIFQAAKTPFGWLRVSHREPICRAH
jgi:hypothetical protein